MRRWGWGLLVGFLLGGCRGEPPAWTADEIRTLQTLWIGSLAPPPPDPSNAVHADPAAAELGRQLFSDPGFSANGRIACATCHQPDRAFTDGQVKSRGIGMSRRHSPTLVGAAYSPWQFWDGRADSLWAQALSPLEQPTEQGFTRVAVARRLSEEYRASYDALFDPLPDMRDRARFPEKASPVGDAAAQAAWNHMAPADRERVDGIFANAGKSIAAFERTLKPSPARFDAYVQAVVEDDRKAMAQALSPNEVEGLRLFIGKARCIQCHNGPRFTNDGFHNTGLPLVEPATGPEPADPDAGNQDLADAGRAEGVWQAIQDPFNCLGSFSDAAPEACAELNHVEVEGPGAAGAFKTPTLRDVAKTAPYMHNGQLATLRAVIEHYDEAPIPFNGTSDLLPLGLSTAEMDALEAFLRSLSAEP